MAGGGDVACFYPAACSRSHTIPGALPNQAQAGGCSGRVCVCGCGCAWYWHSARCCDCECKCKARVYVYMGFSGFCCTRQATYHTEAPCMRMLRMCHMQEHASTQGKLPAASALGSLVSLFFFKKKEAVSVSLRWGLLLSFLLHCTVALYRLRL